ncbi:MAG: hypothetical protein AAGN46_12550 [Acidobacteriota bacterium]
MSRSLPCLQSSAALRVMPSTRWFADWRPAVLIAMVVFSLAASSLGAVEITSLTFPDAPFQEGDLVTVKIEGTSVASMPEVELFDARGNQVRFFVREACFFGLCPEVPFEPMTITLGRFDPGSYTLSLVASADGPTLATADFEVSEPPPLSEGWRLRTLPDEPTDNDSLILGLSRIGNICESAKIVDAFVRDDQILLGVDVDVAVLCFPAPPEPATISTEIGLVAAGTYSVGVFPLEGGQSDPGDARLTVQFVGEVTVADAPDALSLGPDGRFQVTATWRTADGDLGVARPSSARTNVSGVLTFFARDNWEVTVKVLDGCGVNDRFWVFLSAATDVEYEVTVTDTMTGLTEIYRNALGEASPAFTDTDAFPCDG